MGKADWTKGRRLTLTGKADWARGGCVTLMGGAPPNVPTPGPADWARGGHLGRRWLVIGQHHLPSPRVCR